MKGKISISLSSSSLNIATEVSRKGFHGNISAAIDWIIKYSDQAAFYQFMARTHGSEMHKFITLRDERLEERKHRKDEITEEMVRS